MAMENHILAFSSLWQVILLVLKATKRYADSLLLPILGNDVATFKYFSLPFEILKTMKLCRSNITKFYTTILYNNIFKGEEDGRWIRLLSKKKKKKSVILKKDGNHWSI